MLAMQQSTVDQTTLVREAVNADLQHRTVNEITLVREAGRRSVV